MPHLTRLHIEDDNNSTIYGPQYVDNQLINLCAFAWLKFRNTLTELDLTYLNNDFGRLKRFGGLYQYLLRFPNLQHLNLYPEIFNRELMDVDLPLLIRSNKKLEILRVHGEYKFTTTDDTKRSIETTDRRRAMKMIGVYSLKVMDVATLSFNVEEVTIGDLTFKPDTFQTLIRKQPRLYASQMKIQKLHLNNWRTVARASRDVFVLD